MNPAHKHPRNPWPIVIISYFAIFIPCMIAFVVFATRQKMDLVRGDYYDDEIRYQQQLDRIDRTSNLAAPAEITYDTSQRAITISLPSLHSPAQATGNIRLYRPSDDSLDQQIELAVGQDGIQHVNARALRAGLWKVRVYWTVNGQEYFSAKSLVIPAAQS